MNNCYQNTGSPAPDFRTKDGTDVVCHSECLGTETKYWSWSKLTPATTDDEKVCAAACPPTMNDLTTRGFTFDPSQNTAVNAELAKFNFVKDSDSQCYDGCNLYIPLQSGDTTIECVTECPDGEYIYKDASMNNVNDIYCIKTTDSQFEFSGTGDDTTVYRFENAAG